MSDAPSEFGRNALTGELVQMTSEERLIRSITHPESLQPGGNAITPSKANRITTARIRHFVSELTALAAPDAMRCLQQISTSNPVIFMEIYMQLLEFSIPKVKAVAIAQMTPGDNPNPQSMSMGDLLGLLHAPDAVEQ